MTHTHYFGVLASSFPLDWVGSAGVAPLCGSRKSQALKLLASDKSTQFNAWRGSPGELCSALFHTLPIASELVKHNDMLIAKKLARL